MKIVLFANTDWYLYNFRRSLAQALVHAGNDVLLLSPPGPYGTKLIGLGFRWEALPMDRRSLNPWSEIRLLIRLWSLFRREKPDLVHGFTIKAAVYGSLAARVAGVSARVSAVAGMGYVFTSDDAKARVLRPLVRVLLALAMGGKRARLVLQNPDDVQQFVDAGLVSRDAIRLIPSSGVDCGRFTVDSNTRPKPDQPLRVLLAARLLKQKGLYEFAEASRLLKLRGLNVVCILAGTPDAGNPDSVSEATVLHWVELGLVEWLGHVDDMVPLLQSCNVMALPSYYGEGLPRSLIEAGASGLAVVTTDMPGCRQAIEPNRTGLLIPPRDAGALAEALEHLDRDRAFTAQLGSEGRQRVLAEFDEQIVIFKTLEIYKEVLSSV
jgi:glycosyltransferase involved in cell wall biosynthesis